MNSWNEQVGFFDWLTEIWFHIEELIEIKDQYEFSME
jgi:hypothetical protein